MTEPPLVAPVPTRRPSVLRYSLVALVLAVTAAAVWFVVAWAHARNDWSAANAAWLKATDELLATEEVSTAGRSAIVTFHTLDYRNVDAGLDNWEKASTGPLHDEVVTRRASNRQAIQKAKTSTTAEALSAAVTALDQRAGTATMIAAMKVTVTVEGKPADPKYLRIQATLRHTDGGWKLSGIGQVSVGG